MGYFLKAGLVFLQKMFVLFISWHIFCIQNLIGGSIMEILNVTYYSLSVDKVYLTTVKKDQLNKHSICDYFKGNWFSILICNW